MINKPIKQHITILLVLMLLLCPAFLTSCTIPGVTPEPQDEAAVSLDDIPEFDGSLTIEINGNRPGFTDEELKEAKEAYKFFGDLDKHGRCTTTQASLSYKTMPDQQREQRGDISEVHPSGWHSGMEWERMHLIAWALCGENANECNLITGTHDCNFNAMRNYEVKTARYLEDNPRKHVLYRVTPIFRGKELVARGVQMEAESVEDKGRGLCFNIYCYNVRRDGAVINYKTGTVDVSNVAGQEEKSNDKRLYVLNTNTMKFHYPSCAGVQDISDYNKQEVKATRQELINKGYDPCGMCQP
ncbi:MAG: DNA/RNA non-specific endonuclease [Firmicutes bacterium]|nr:DNA/RNA non-specific endonuclease [Bacillota bacterium]